LIERKNAYRLASSLLNSADRVPGPVPVVGADACKLLGACAGEVLGAWSDAVVGAGPFFGMVAGGWPTPAGAAQQVVVQQLWQPRRPNSRVSELPHSDIISTKLYITYLLLEKPENIHTSLFLAA